jgi:hypothetical protein
MEVNRVFPFLPCRNLLEFEERIKLRTFSFSKIASGKNGKNKTRPAIGTSLLLGRRGNYLTVKQEDAPSANSGRFS